METIKPWWNSDNTVQIRWVRATAAPLGIMTAFGCRDYEDHDIYNPPATGEVGVFRLHRSERKNAWDSGDSGLIFAAPTKPNIDPQKIISGYDFNTDPGLENCENLGNCCDGTFIYGGRALGSKGSVNGAKPLGSVNLGDYDSDFSNDYNIGDL